MKLIGFDLETEGDRQEFALQPFRATTGQARIKAASASVNAKTTGRLYPDLEYLKHIISLAINSDSYLVGWNVAFDAAWCIAVGLEAEVFKVKWLDGMLLWRHAVVEPEGEDTPRPKRKKYSLEAAMKEFYPEHADFKDFKDFQATDQESLDLLLHRNKMDAMWTVKLTEKFWAMLSPAQQRAALIEARCIPLMSKTKVLGIKSSRIEAENLSAALAEEAIRLYRELMATAPEVRGINLGSPKQLQDLLYNQWGLMAERFSKKTGDPSTDKYALFDLAAIDPRAALLKKLREAKNNRTKYAQGTVKSLDYNGDGYVRPQAKIFSTYTSRITYGSSDTAEIQEEKTTKAKGLHVVTRKIEVPVGIALHQWKRGKEYRRLIQPPPGYTLAEFDFSGQEFRWMAVASGDETMLSLCAPGEDAHSYMGAQIAQVDYRELVSAIKAGDKSAANDRKCGKFCIAEGQLVLTDKGLIPIEKISLLDKVWDGIEWVTHDGLIYQGEREVMTYGGLTATPDHIVYLEDGTTTSLENASNTRSLLAVSGDGALPVITHFRLTYVAGVKIADANRVCWVYDLANAGPRHRFTVSNYLISNCNLSYQYRVSPRTATVKARVEYEMDVDEAFIKGTQIVYKTSYPEVGGLPSQRIGGYWAKQIQKCKQLGYAETFAGRRVQLKGNWTGKEAWGMESTAINYPIQGTGGDQKYLALAVARNHLAEFGGYFYYELHDGIFLIFPHSKAQAAAEFFLETLSNLPYKQAWGVDLPIKFPVDAKLGESWGELKELDTNK